MFSDKTEAQEFAVRVLGGHLKQGRLAHTYLFSGEGQSGKEDLALAFACAVNCEAGRYFKSCECLSCSKTERGIHPDVQWVGEDADAKSIKIEDVRGVIEKAYLKPLEGKWKVFLVKDADRLTLDAANAFLKTLEEPPAHTIFVLLVESRMHLLETIQSRAFEIRLRPLKGYQGDEIERLGDLLSRYPDGVWDDFLKGYLEKPREDFKKTLVLLLSYLSESLKRKSSDESAAAADLKGWIGAFDSVMEAKEALDDNANQKLTLTRLSVRLGNSIPLDKVVL